VTCYREKGYSWPEGFEGEAAEFSYNNSFPLTKSFLPCANLLWPHAPGQKNWQKESFKTGKILVKQDFILFLESNFLLISFHNFS